MTKELIKDNIEDIQFRKKLDSLKEECHKWCAIAILHNHELFNKIKETRI